MQDAFSVSIAGVYLCGMAAGLAYQRVGLHMVATDLIAELPNAMKPFDKINYKIWRFSIIRERRRNNKII